MSQKEKFLRIPSLFNVALFCVGVVIGFSATDPTMPMAGRLMTAYIGSFLTLIAFALDCFFSESEGDDFGGWVSSFFFIIFAIPPIFVPFPIMFLVFLVSFVVNAMAGFHLFAILFGTVTTMFIMVFVKIGIQILAERKNRRN